MTSSTDVSWQLDGMTMFGTFARPDGDGPHPAVVMVAGSGPTDRDWTSPLIPGTNGSAALLAEAFAAAGIASLRYDKRASGPHVRDNLPQLTGRMSMQSHLDELTAAVGVLAARDDVDADRIVGLGNSEGCLHVLHYAVSGASRWAVSAASRGAVSGASHGAVPGPVVPLVGIVLAAPPGRGIGAVLRSQLSQQLGLVPGGADLVPLVEQAAERFSAGEPMDPDPRLPEQVRQILVSFEAPANLPFARELWSEDATAVLPDVNVPVLVVIGRADAQIDADADGQPLQQAAREMPNVQFAFPRNANHVLKEDVRTAAERAAAPGAGYNDAGTRLDPEALADILAWLRPIFHPVLHPGA